MHAFYPLHFRQNVGQDYLETFFTYLMAQSSLQLLGSVDNDPGSNEPCQDDSLVALCMQGSIYIGISAQLKIAR